MSLHLDQTHRQEGTQVVIHLLRHDVDRLVEALERTDCWEVAIALEIQPCDLDKPAAEAYVKVKDGSGGWTPPLVRGSVMALPLFPERSDAPIKTEEVPA